MTPVAGVLLIFGNFLLTVELLCLHLFLGGSLLTTDCERTAHPRVVSRKASPLCYPLSRLCFPLFIPSFLAKAAESMWKMARFESPEGPARHLNG